MISETEIDDSFSIGNFRLLPYTLDRDPKGGRIMLYIREDISSNFLATDKGHIESLMLN